MTAEEIMDRDAVRATIRDQLADILDRDEVALTDASTADAVEGWDSLVQLKLLVALEDACRVKFQLAEMDSPANVGELVDLIVRKRAAASGMSR